MTDPILWDGTVLHLLDQRALPHVKEYMKCDTLDKVCYGIREMVVRGAPAIGVTAAFGYVIGIREGVSSEETVRRLAETRPTAVNLFWALAKMRDHHASHGAETLAEYAEALMQDDINTNKQMGAYGQSVIADGARCLTHCNAGALATAGYGTALGVFRAARDAGKKIHVYMDETRPYLQGARLTAFEMVEEGIDCTLLCDNMAGWMMKKGEIDVIVVGADRIAANGDAANKIGTYSVAVLAKHHGIPFYIAAPFSTFDLTLATGDEIPIEERSRDEVTSFGGKLVAPHGVGVRNPSFDVTPNELIAGIITEKGIIRPNYRENILLFSSK